MNSNDVILLGLKGTVVAISKETGQEIWSTKLPGGGSHFVTLLGDSFKVFAYSNGHLYCLDLVRGTVLWSNDLPGMGYGLASLCFADGRSVPDPSIVKSLKEAGAAQNSAVMVPPAG
jgi:outer membrane protein assembly factor BamB